MRLSPCLAKMHLTRKLLVLSLRFIAKMGLGLQRNALSN